MEVAYVDACFSESPPPDVDDIFQDEDVDLIDGNLALEDDSALLQVEDAAVKEQCVALPQEQCVATKNVIDPPKDPEDGQKKKEVSPKDGQKKNKFFEFWSILLSKFIKN